LGVPTLAKLPRVHFPKTPQIGPGIGISSLNETMNNFTTVHAISAQISLIGATWRNELKNFHEITKISFWGSLFEEKNDPNEDFKP
jgi:hypothetical protein